jgi:hypothetical protein
MTFGNDNFFFDYDRFLFNTARQSGRSQFARDIYDEWRTAEKVPEMLDAGIVLVEPFVIRVKGPEESPYDPMQIEYWNSLTENHNITVWIDPVTQDSSVHSEIPTITNMR